MKYSLTSLVSCLILTASALANGEAGDRGGLIGADAPAGQRHVYGHSASKPREMEIFFPPNHDPAKSRAPGQDHGFFNKDPWQTVTLLAADRFPSRFGLLNGGPSKKMPATGEKLLVAEP
jgi:hypothetical protein